MLRPLGTRACFFVNFFFYYFGLYLWVVDVNVIIVFRLSMMSFGLGFSTLSAEK
jgi:hypothetical protein